VPSKQPKRGRLWLNYGSCIRLRPEWPNHVWAYDFVLMRTHDGRAVRLLAVIHAAFAPLHREGTIQLSIQEVYSTSQDEGARIAHLRPEQVEMPDTVREMITRYATSPQGVAGMVTKGHALAKWLQTADSIR